eukprot:6233528-Prymnesium_polylepis.1
MAGSDTRCAVTQSYSTGARRSHLHTAKVRANKLQPNGTYSSAVPRTMVIELRLRASRNVTMSTLLLPVEDSDPGGPESP